MKLNRTGIAFTVVALAVALAPGAAWADQTITVSYKTSDNNGTICVDGIPEIEVGKKSLPIKKLDQKIKWALDRTSGEDAGGTWEIKKLVGGSNPSVDLCQDEIIFDKTGKAECRVAAQLKYSYDLIWSKEGCGDPIIADPVIIFEGGGGPFKPVLLYPLLWALGAAAVAFAAGHYLAKRRA